MYTLSVLCIVLCALCLPFLVFGQACKVGYYGDDCSMRCEGCNDGTCHTNGNCRDISDCKPGFYQLPMCNKQCGNCWKTWCLVNGGNCLSGCKVGWYGDKCMDLCKVGYYGPGCSMNCEGCKAGCDYNHGTCRTNECNDGFYELPFCNKRCGHCNSPYCEITDGTCPYACQEGWKGSKCSDPCEDGFYGSGCSLKCGACNNSSCLANGICTDGCEDGWLGDKCTRACDEGYYGPNCTLKCGACKDRICQPTGNCTSACNQGWEGDACMQAIVIETPSSTETTNLWIILSVVCAVLALLALQLCCVARRRKQREEELEKKGTKPPPKGAQPPPKGTQPPPKGTQPPPKGTQPPPKGTQPPPKGTQPPPKGT